MSCKQADTSSASFNSNKTVSLSVPTDDTLSVMRSTPIIVSYGGFKYKQVFANSTSEERNTLSILLWFTLFLLAAFSLS